MFFLGVFVVDLILMTRHHYHYHHELLSLQNSVQQMFNSFFTPLNSTQLGSNVVFEFEVHLQNAINEETIVKPKNDSRAQMKQCTYIGSPPLPQFLSLKKTTVLEEGKYYKGFEPLCSPF